MYKATQGKELVIRTENRIGVLAELTKILAEHGFDILAVSCWEEGADAVIRLITDDLLRTGDALREHHYPVTERDVVLVHAAHKPGVLRHITDVLARENINLFHLFGTATINQDECLIVLDSSHNQHAIVCLNK